MVDNVNKLYDAEGFHIPKSASTEVESRGLLLRRMLRRRMLRLHSHRHHRFGSCGSGVAQDAGRRGRGERIRAVHELHRALANVTRTGDEQSRGEAAQIVAEVTSRLNGLLAADR